MNRRKFLLLSGASVAALALPMPRFASGGVIVTPDFTPFVPAAPEEIIPTARLICTGRVYLAQTMRGEEIIREIVTEEPNDGFTMLHDAYHEAFPLVEPDTSDIPECNAEWFKHAKLQEPER